MVLAGLPLGREEAKPQQKVETTTVAESTAPAPSATIIEIPGDADESFEISTTTTQAPPAVTATNAPVTPPPMTSQQAEPPQDDRQARATVPPRSEPAVPRNEPAPPREDPPARVVPKPRPEMTASEASSTLRGYVVSRRFYPAASECIRVENRGYQNVGYNMEVWHSCAGGGASRLLGRWRVDSKTGEVFVRNDSGRYVRP